jgi:predicted RNase H-like HicB family nuclease
MKMKQKTIEYYLSLPYKLEIIPDTEEGGYGARYPELPGCITCGETLELVTKNAEDAKKEWLLSAIEDGIEIPEPVTDDENKYSGQFKLRIPKILHKTLADHAKREGISMNQYCMYLLSRNDATYRA